MRTIRVHIPQDLQPGREYALPESVVAHVVRVLRLGVDDALEVFNGDGQAYSAVITRQDKRGVYARINSASAVSLESPLRCTLLQGVSRGDKMDYTVQKAVELGVSEIIPVITERCGVQLDAERWAKKQEHWQSVVHSACEQSGRNVVPTVAAVQKLDVALASLASSCRLTLDPYAQDSLVNISLSDDIALLIGPEGGLSEHDLRVARACGFHGARLGPRILRTETAALAALSVLQMRGGDFG